MDGESPRDPSTSTYVVDAVAEGEPQGHGLYVWTRGEEVRREEPALCADCATAIGVSALSLWSAEEEEG
jgi:hypothetical protein